MLMLFDFIMVEVEIFVVVIGVQLDDWFVCQVGCRVDNGIVVGVDCVMSVVNIFVVGDVVCFVYLVFDVSVRIEVWQYVRWYGVYVVWVMLGGVVCYVEIFWFWIDQYGVNVQVVGFLD